MGLRLLLSGRVFASMHQVLGLIPSNPTKISQKGPHLQSAVGMWTLSAEDSLRSDRVY